MERTTDEDHATGTDRSERDQFVPAEPLGLFVFLHLVLAGVMAAATRPWIGATFLALFALSEVIFKVRGTFGPMAEARSVERPVDGSDPSVGDQDYQDEPFWMRLLTSLPLPVLVLVVVGGGQAVTLLFLLKFSES